MGLEQFLDWLRQRSRPLTILISSVVALFAVLKWVEGSFEIAEKACKIAHICVVPIPQGSKPTSAPTPLSKITPDLVQKDPVHNPVPAPPLPPKFSITLIRKDRVYFDFNKSNLTEAAQATVKDDVDLLISEPEYHVIIQPYSDTEVTENGETGAPLDAKTIDAKSILAAKGRGEAIRDELVRNGIRSERIHIFKPIIATTIREPRSRAADIKVGPPN